MIRASLALAIAALPLFVTSIVEAQSMPPGQVVHRQFTQVQTNAASTAGVGQAPTPLTMEEDEVILPKAPACVTQSLVPLWRKNCHTDAQVNDFFNESSWVDAGEQAQYLYNAPQSASVLRADLLTTTFQPGFQVVLAGAVTSGSSSSSSSTTDSSASVTRRADTSSSSNSSTDSADTAIAKLESGGDFNTRFVLPLLWKHNDSASLTSYLLPNVGFYVNGLTSQNTITESTQYAVNLPLELYGQLNSTQGASTPAVLFIDVKPAGEFISKTLAAKLGPSVPTAIFLGEASAGIEFAQRIRVSLQYVYGNASIYSATSSTTSNAAATPSTSRIGGFHLAVSFSPKKPTS